MNFVELLTIHMNDLSIGSICFPTTLFNIMIIIFVCHSIALIGFNIEICHHIHDFHHNYSNNLTSIWSLIDSVIHVPYHTIIHRIFFFQIQIILIPTFLFSIELVKMENCRKQQRQRSQNLRQRVIQHRIRVTFSICRWIRMNQPIVSANKFHTVKWLDAITQR